jgi:hypothetical protein
MVLMGRDSVGWVVIQGLELKGRRKRIGPMFATETFFTLYCHHSPKKKNPMELHVFIPKSWKEDVMERAERHKLRCNLCPDM